MILKSISLRIRKLYAAFGKYFDENGIQIISTAVYCYENGEWKKLPDIPYVGDSVRSSSPQSTVMQKGACAAVREGLVFFNCPADGGGNAFLYRTDNGVCEPLYLTFTDYKANYSLFYSAVETKDGLYYIEEDSDQYMESLNLYLLSAESGAYLPDYQEAALYGDVDGNGKVTIEDATLLQQYPAEFSMPKCFILKAADVNGDGKASVADVTCIQRYLAGFAGGSGRTGKAIG